MRINELVGILNGYFGWNKARMSCFAKMLVALIKVRTVNLQDLACAFESQAKLDSRYKRIKRFFSKFTLDFSCLASWVVGIFDLLDQPVYLSIDRTNWLWGKSNINILMLSIVYKGVALPLLWSLLSKRGNSDTEERITLIKRFIKQFGSTCISGLLGDREFIGDEWFAWLIKNNISFCIRIKSNLITTNSEGRERVMRNLFHALKPGEKVIFKDARKLWKQKVFLSTLRLTDGKLLILAADKLLEDPFNVYSKRWEIETLFGCLKTKGFRFEDTHITKPERIEKLLFLLTIAFCWAHKIGEWRHTEKPIIIKKHGRKFQSYFRYGLDYLRDILLNITEHTVEKLAQLMRPLRIFEGSVRCLV
jgi:SAM-dependent methyltransferase